MKRHALPAYLKPEQLEKLHKIAAEFSMATYHCSLSEAVGRLIDGHKLKNGGKVAS